MNLLLLDDADFLSPHRVRLSGRRQRHVVDVHRARVGDELRVGRLGGQVGTGHLVALDDGAVELEVTLDRDPPAPSPLILVLALPRPKVLRRVVAAVTALGIKKLVLLHTYRVEKSYWQSPRLGDDELREGVRLGLEQGRDTLPPEISLERRFRPFTEDRLPALAAGRRALVAHPGAMIPCPSNVGGESLLAVGPEGGFIDFEIEGLARAGLEPVTLGPRPLTVETAVAALVGRLLPILR